MQGNDDRKMILAIMITVMGIVLLMVSFILPWWGLHLEMDGSASGGGFGVSISSGISYQGSGTGFYIGSSTSIVYSVAAVLIILALICASLMVTALIISLINNNMKPKFPLQLGVLAMVFCLLAPIIFMIALPMSMKADAEKEAEDSGNEYVEPDRDDPTKSFFGSYEEEGVFHTGTTKSNWGGDIGWVLSFISFLFLAISVNLIRPRKAAPPIAQVAPPEGIYVPEPQPPHQIRYSQPPPPPPPSK
ncbi:MAG: hypothetical protein JSW00_03925 [Thermoplasmata archaeon]|nr:MAG: hypothetical protein JSW00_03925 [Thermoplasmata archaeon]